MPENLSGGLRQSDVETVYEDCGVGHDVQTMEAGLSGPGGRDDFGWWTAGWLHAGFSSAI
jgi:hypothetical protein